MKILAIETSCDETAVAILECEGQVGAASFTVLGNALLSQIDIHKEFGGVFPALAKREHARNLTALLQAALEEASLLEEREQVIKEETWEAMGTILLRESGLAAPLFEFLKETERPDIDAIAVTSGPGLEPALWVGINFAKVLSLVWNIPLVAVNHMEGHLLSALAKKEGSTIVIRDVDLPVLALLVSGGHTELVLMRDWLSYELLGQTRDDAVGEAYDKVARMMGLSYPGGPEVSRLAERARKSSTTMLPPEDKIVLPRPMIDSDNLDFSFSGLKTAVLYRIKEKPMWGEVQKEYLARAFEDAVADVLWEKTRKALELSGAKTVVMGGGVSANTHLQRVFSEAIQSHEAVRLRIPEKEFTTDNALMIGIAGYFRASLGTYTTPEEIRADGTRRLV